MKAKFVEKNIQNVQKKGFFLLKMWYNYLACTNSDIERDTYCKIPFIQFEFMIKKYQNLKVGVGNLAQQFGTAAVLAGGRSNRKNQTFMQPSAADRTKLLHYVVKGLREVFSDVLVVTDTPWAYEDMPVRVAEDIYQGYGPLGGIHTALKNSQSQYMYLIAADIPYLCPQYIAYMLNMLSAQRAQACVTLKENWIEPFNAFYSVELFYDLEAWLSRGNSSLYNFLRASNTLVIPEETARSFDQELKMFRNLNTLQEYVNFFRSQSDGLW
jgi:molybdopterin-guanine dinucleotide biosynthesis protein A